MEKQIPIYFDSVIVDSPFQGISESNPNIGRLKVRVFTKYGNRNGSYITEAVANAVLTSVSHFDAKAIIVPTSGGHSARVISNLRPHPLILALCSSEAVARRLSLNYGVYPIIVSVDHNDMDDVVNICREVAVKVLGLKEHDVVVIAGGIHANKSIKQTNFMKIEEI